jgi:radical SAM protein with 4Fe4S-binding SPASM domain
VNEAPTRRRLQVLSDAFFPAYVVWELTLRCDQTCAHCGSRAGKARPDELSTQQALEVVGQLADMKAREVVLIGGEAYLHEGFLPVIEALTKVKIRAVLTTGGRGITTQLANDAVAHGLASVSVSIDGLQENHDRIRRAKGSFDSACGALKHFRETGIPIAVNTNVNRINQHDLEGLYETLKDLGISSWQIQITTPLGRAADRPHMILQPFDLLDIMPRIAALKERAFQDNITIMPGNNLGYFGPEEGALRSLSPEGKDHWLGCQAGRFVMGIESNGSVKGCPSLQSYAYVGGNLKEKSMADIWQESSQLAFARERSVDDLWGFCKECPFAATCLGGCSFTAHALFGKTGNNPYCHFRARTMAKNGKRERIVLKSRAPGVPFDHGLFAIEEELI